MPFIPDLRDAVVRALNRINKPAQSAVLADVKVIGVTPYAGERLDVTITGNQNQPTYGEYTTQLKRQNIADYFAAVGPLKVPTSATLHILLPRLQQSVGFTMTTDDFEDTPITWVDGKAQVTFTAKPGSVFWYGSATATLLDGDLDMSVAYLAQAVTVGSNITNLDQLITYYGVSARRAVDLERVEVTGPFTLEEAGLTNASYNSVIILTAKPFSGFKGSRTVFFNRFNLATAEGKTTLTPDDFTGNTRDALLTETLGMGTAVPVVDIRDDVLPDGWPKTTKLVAMRQSVRVFGEANVTVKRFMDDAKVINVTIGSGVYAYSDATWDFYVYNKYPSAGRITINVNVAADALMFASTNTNHAIPIKRMPTVGDVIWNIVNRGIISGRGGTGQANGVTPVKATDGINIAADFKGVVNIENYGLIAGGGGGGDAQGYPGCIIPGNGGVPSGDAGSGDYNAPGQVGGQKVPAPEVYLTGSDGKKYFNGAGGGFGQPGKHARFESYTNGVLKSASEGTSPYTMPGQPGASIGGQLAAVKWIAEGTTMPPAKKPYADFLDYLSTLSTTALIDSDNMSRVSTLPVVVQMYGGSISNNWKQSITTKNALYGSPFKGPVLVRPECMLFAVISHCFPHPDPLYDNYFTSRKVLMYLSDAGSASSPTPIYRNYINSLGSAEFPAKRVDKFVYYDGFKGMMMECNPFLGTDPVPWVRPS